jgi:predicted permease
MSGAPRPLPRWPERVARRWLPSGALGDSFIGDLREEYAHRPASVARDVAYAVAAIGLGLSYAVRGSDPNPPRSRSVLRTIVGDLRLGARTLARQKTYLAGTWLTLALGLSAAATIATVVYDVRLRPLPYPRAEELVRFGDAGHQMPDACCSSASIANFLDVSARATLFQSVAADVLTRAVVTSDHLNERVLGAQATSNFLDVLGLPLVMGRSFQARDADSSSANVVVINESLARRHFGTADPLGQRMAIDLVPHVVIGVIPDSVFVPGAPAFWTTFRWSGVDRGDRRRRRIEPIGRLKPGVTPIQAQSELRAIFTTLAAEHPAENRNWTMALTTFDDWIAGSAGAQPRAVMPLIGAAAAAMLLVSFINVTGLALGRVERMRQEQALRRALGATMARLVSRAIADAAIVVVPATVVAAIAASLLIRVVMTQYGDGLPRAESVVFDGSTIATLLVGALGAMAGLVAIALTAARGSTSLRQIDARTASPRSFWWRRGLVTAEVALGATLLYGSLLVGGTVWALSQVDLGVATDRTLTFTVALPHERYPTPAAVSGFFASFADRVGELPAVESVGATSRRPFNGGTNGGVSSADDRSKSLPLAEYRSVTPDLFRALSLRVVTGSTFTSANPTDDGHRLVVSTSLAQALFGTTEVVGRRVMLEDSEPFEIIGVVSDFRDFGPTSAPRPTLYARHGAGEGWMASPQLTMVVRERPGGPDLWPALRTAVHAADPDLLMDTPATLAVLADRAVGVSRRTAAGLLELFSAVVVILAAIGIFSVVAVSVERRRREIGIRLALGETPARVRRRTVTDAVRLAVLGVAIAAAGMFWIERLVSAFVVSSFRLNAFTIGGAVLIFFAALAVAAAAAPARRAAMISTTELLRGE